MLSGRAACQHSKAAPCPAGFSCWSAQLPPHPHAHDPAPIPPLPARRLGTYGQLGNDKVSVRQLFGNLYVYDPVQENAPVAVAQGSLRLAALSCSVSGPPHACALDAAGRAVCWGDARMDGWDAGAVPKPTEVPGQPAGGFRAISAAETNCGLAQATGQAFCFKWGERLAALAHGPAAAQLPACTLRTGSPLHGPSVQPGTSLKAR